MDDQFLHVKQVSMFNDRAMATIYLISDND